MEENKKIPNNKKISKSKKVEEVKQSNISGIIIGFLLAVVLGLVCYICYDKGILFNNNQPENNNEVIENNQTTQKEVPVLIDEPCRLSYNHEQATNIQSGAAVVSQSITLFIRPDLVIKPGSVIEITQNNVKERYHGSGQPAIYSNHQEIILQLYDGNA